MATVGEVMVRVGADDSGFQSTMRNTSSTLKSTGEKMQKAGKTMTARVTTPIVGLGAAMVATAGNFQSSMNRVEAVSGATGKQMGRLEDQARDLGSTTQFSASQAADGMGFLAQAGFETEDIISAMPGTLDLAAAGQLELAEAADIASNVLTGYGKEASDIGRVNDVLATTASSANTDVQQLGQAMSMVAPVANSAGVAFEETSALMGMLGDAGIQSSRAGTTLRAALSRLENPSNQAADAIERLGVNTHDAEGNLRPMHDIIGQFEDAGLSAGDAMTIFGQRAGPGMAALVEQGSDKLRSLTGELENSGGAAQEMADTQMQGLPGAMARLRSAAEGLAIAIADSGLVDWVASVAEKVAGLFQRLAETNPTLLKLGVIIAGVAAAIGPLLVVGGMMVTAMGTLAGAVAAVSLPVVAVVAAIAALAAGLVYAYNKSETFRNIVQAAWQAVREAIGVAVDWIVNVVGQMVDQIRAWWDQHGAQITARAKAIWDQIQQTFQSAWDAISGIVQWGLSAVRQFWDGFAGPFLSSVKSMWDNVLEFVQGAWNGISKVIEGALQIIQGIFDVFAGVFTGNWTQVWNGVKSILQGVWNAIVGILETAWATIKGVVSTGVEVVRTLINAALNGIKTIFSGAWNTVVTIVTGAWDNVTGAVSSGISTMMSFIGEIPGKVKGFFSDAGSWLIDAGKNIVSGLIDGIGSMVGAVGDKMSDIASTVTSRLPWSPAKAGPLRTHPPEEGGRNIAEMVGDGIASVDLSGKVDPQLSALVAGPDVAATSRAAGSDGRQVSELSAADRKLLARIAAAVEDDREITMDGKAVGRQLGRAFA